jgi:hypothetical protein
MEDDRVSLLFESFRAPLNATFHPYALLACGLYFQHPVNFFKPHYLVSRSAR